MSIPSPLRYSPLNSQQREWLRGQSIMDGSPTPPPIQGAWQLNDGSDNAWQLNDGSDNSWLLNQS